MRKRAVPLGAARCFGCVWQRVIHQMAAVPAKRIWVTT